MCVNYVHRKIKTSDVRPQYEISRRVLLQDDFNEISEFKEKNVKGEVIRILQCLKKLIIVIVIKYSAWSAEEKNLPISMHFLSDKCDSSVEMVAKISV